VYISADFNIIKAVTKANVVTSGNVSNVFVFYYRIIIIIIKMQDL